MIMKGEEKRAFTTEKLNLVHNLTVDCLTFAHFLLPSHTFNDFLGHHHHWMEWLGAAIDINGFSMVLMSGNHWFRWFTMVFHHCSKDGMVAYHRWSLLGVLHRLSAYVASYSCVRIQKTRRGRKPSVAVLAQGRQGRRQLCPFRHLVGSCLASEHWTSFATFPVSVKACATFGVLLVSTLF